MLGLSWCCLLAGWFVAIKSLKHPLTLLPLWIWNLHRREMKKNIINGGTGRAFG